MLLTKKYEFCASHRLHVDSLTEEENQELFGKCNNPYGHGHNYVLHVAVRGEPNPDNGMILDRDALDALVREEVLPRIDHKDMNRAVPEFDQLVPTTENLAKVMGEWLCEAFRRRAPQGVKLSRIILEETGRNTFVLDMEQ